MMSSIGPIFFALCSIACLVGALITISARNPIRGAVGLLATVVGIAGLFVRLSAQFLAAIQLIVYAGAVVVLFVFVIMLLGPDASGVKPGPVKGRISRALAALLALALSLIFMLMLAGTTGAGRRLGAVRSDHGSTELVGGFLFTRAMVPFELTTALLIVAVIGAIAVARGRPPKRREKESESPTERMFHGPLHPRDAGRPLDREGLG